MVDNLTLHTLPVGREAVVVDVCVAEAEKRRLESLGIIPGADLSVLSRNAGSILLAIGSARVALEPEVACNVFII